MNCPRFIQGRQTIWNLHSEKSVMGRASASCSAFRFIYRQVTRCIALPWSECWDMLGCRAGQASCFQYSHSSSFCLFWTMHHGSGWETATASWSVQRFNGATNKMGFWPRKLWTSNNIVIFMGNPMIACGICGFGGTANQCSLWTNPWSVCQAPILREHRYPHDIDWSIQFFLSSCRQGVYIYIYGCDTPLISNANPRVCQ